VLLSLFFLIVDFFDLIEGIQAPVIRIQPSKEIW